MGLDGVGPDGVGPDVVGLGADGLGALGLGALGIGGGGVGTTGIVIVAFTSTSCSGPAFINSSSCSLFKHSSIGLNTGLLLGPILANLCFLEKAVGQDGLPAVSIMVATIPSTRDLFIHINITTTINTITNNVVSSAFILLDLDTIEFINSLLLITTANINNPTNNNKLFIIL